MGTWNTAIDGNDTFLDMYQRFFQLYNEGKNPVEISEELLADFNAELNDKGTQNNILFGLALAQWETKSLDPVLFMQIKDIVETGNDLEVWKSHGSDEKTISKRKMNLQKFLVKISVAREKAKRRITRKFEFDTIRLLKATSPDNKKEFSVAEIFGDKKYIDTSGIMSFKDGGSGIVNFKGQGKSISAKWLDSQTLEITHDKDIVFIQKKETFFRNGDQGNIVYIPN